MSNDFYKKIVHFSPIGYAYHKIVCNDQGEPVNYIFQEVNTEFERLTGLNKEDILGKGILEIIPEIKDSDFDWIAAYGEVALKGTKKEFTQFSVPLNKWYRIYSYSPKHEYFITYFSDITSEIEKIDDYRKVIDRINRIEAGANIGSWEMDIASGDTYWSDEFFRICGFEPRSFNPTSDLGFSVIHPEDRERAAQAVERAINNKDRYKIEKRIVRPSGEIRWVLSNGVIETDEHGEAVKLIGSFLDITDDKMKDQQIEYMSYHDNLTGLYNRHFFNEELKRLNTARQYPLTIIMGDANGLKLANDVFGHLEGDLLLNTIADIFRSTFRHEDIIARWGGDEFIILLPKTDQTIAKKKCEIIKTKCHEVTKTKIKPSIALGCATKHTELDDDLEILKEAEVAMYNNKLNENKAVKEHMIQTILDLLYDNSNETEEQAAKLKYYMGKLAEELNLSEETKALAEKLAVFHDIGKINIDQAILKKPAKLEADEWIEVKKHPGIGYRIANSISDLRPLSEYVLHHHERYDGTGYPRNLKGEEIPLLSRMMAVVDSYDAMTSDRPYRKALTKEAAIQELIEYSGTQFDPNIVSSFLTILST